MLIQDLNYLEVATDDVQGGYARAFARAGRSTAAGNNFAETEDITDTNTSQALFEFGTPDNIYYALYARLTANGFASSYSQSA